MRIECAGYRLDITLRRHDAVVRQQCLELIRAGLFIEAIKAHRALCGSSLKDAKEFCDKLRGSD